jgi:hypothetical protein
VSTILETIPEPACFDVAFVEVAAEPFDVVVVVGSSAMADGATGLVRPGSPG